MVSAKKRNLRSVPVRIGPGVTLVGVEFLFVQHGKSVLDFEWRIGFDTTFEMRVTEARA